MPAKHSLKTRLKTFRARSGSGQLSAASAKQGFTIIEVMLFLGITGLMLVGVLGGTYSSIARQRYNDSLRSFAEFLRTIFAEVQSPESLGAGNSKDYAIYGKIAVFGLNDGEEDKVYTATLVGDVMPPSSSDGFIEELKAVNARLYCGETASASRPERESTLNDYTMQWGAKLEKPESAGNFTGTVVIARAPTTGTIHAAYTEEPYRIDESCQPGNDAASVRFKEDLQSTPDLYKQDDKLTFCIKSQNSSIVRGIALDLEGHNTSSVSTLPEGEGSCR